MNYNQKHMFTFNVNCILRYIAHRSRLKVDTFLLVNFLFASKSCAIILVW